MTDNTYKKATILAKRPWDTWQNAGWWRVILKWKSLFNFPSPPYPLPRKQWWIYFGWINISIVLGEGSGQKDPYVGKRE